MSDTILIQPLGEDSCNCKKEIFATHDRFYKNTAPSLQVWTLLSKLGDPHPDAASYGASFTYIGDNVAGTHPSGSYAGNGINGWIVYSVLSITQPVDDSNGHYWILGQPDSFGTFNFNRVNANIEAPLVNAECISIQEIKEKDTCTNLETYRYIIEDGTGNLVDVTDIIPNFDENKVLFKCVEPLPILEKEICGTIDGSIDNYELIKIYTREPLTGVQNIIHYEDKFGNIVTGEVVEVCCNCNSLCSLPTLLLNRVCFGYAGSFNGDGQFPADKANLGADIYIDYFEVDGNVLINTPTNLGNTGVATFSDMGYGIAYDSVVNLLNNNALINSNDIRFVTAGNILADRGWGIEYNDAKSYRLVISDYIPNSGVSATWTIVVNPTEQWDGIGNPAGNWTMASFSANVGTAINFGPCNAL
jgi:hypothetical protein